MSIHPSLSAAKGKKHRSVHKRFERMEELKKKGKWKEGDSTFGLPKGKIVKVKIKKAKAAEEKTTEETKEAETSQKATSNQKATSK